MQIKLCKVVSINGELLIPEENIEKTPLDSLIGDLNRGYESIDKLKEHINGKYEIHYKLL